MTNPMTSTWMKHLEILPVDEGVPIVHLPTGRRGVALAPMNADREVFCVVNNGEDGWDFDLIDATDIRIALDRRPGMGHALRLALSLQADIQPQEVRDNIVARYMRNNTRDADRVAIAKAVAKAQRKAVADSINRTRPPWQDW